MIDHRLAEDMQDEARARFEDAVTVLQSRLPRMAENMAFFRGFQWAVEGEGDFFDDSALDPRERMEVRNMVRPTVRAAAASILRSRMNPDVIAASGDQRSRARAEMSQRLVRSFLRNGVFPFDEHYSAVLGAQIYGLSWLQTIWDPFKGEPREVPIRAGGLDPSMDPEDLDEFGMPRVELAWEGEIDVRYVDAIHGIPDPHATKLKEARYFVHWRDKPVSSLYDWFPHDIFGESTYGRWSLDSNDTFAREVETIENDTKGFMRGIGSRGTGSDLADLGRIVEYWERPTNRFPRGRLILYSGHILLAVGPLPYRFPWTGIKGLNVLPGALYPDGLVHDIKSPQRALNRSEAKKSELIDLACNPAILVPKTAGVDDDHFENLVGAIIQYNPGGKPEWMPQASIPGALFEEAAAQERSIANISTHNEISRGETVGNVTAARAISYLHELQQGAQAPDDEMARDSEREVLQNCLYLARDFYDEGRSIRIIGKNGRWMFQPFRKKDYDFETEIIVESRSGAPNSRALRMAETIELMGAGFFEDTPAAERGRRMLEMDTEDRSTVDPYEAHRSRAEMEQLEFLEDPYGVVLEVLEQDADQIHLECHDLFRISPEYLEFPPEVRERFDIHCAVHEQHDAMKKAIFAQQEGALTDPSQSVSGGAPPAKARGVESPLDGGHNPTATPIRGEERIGA